MLTNAALLAFKHYGSTFLEYIYPNTFTHNWALIIVTNCIKRIWDICVYRRWVSFNVTPCCDLNPAWSHTTSTDHCLTLFTLSFLLLTLFSVICLCSSNFLFRLSLPTSIALSLLPLKICSLFFCVSLWFSISPGLMYTHSDCWNMPVKCTSTWNKWVSWLEVKWIMQQEETEKHLHNRASLSFKMCSCPSPAVTHAHTLLRDRKSTRLNSSHL